MPDFKKTCHLELPPKVDILFNGRRRVTRRFRLDNENNIDDVIFDAYGTADPGTITSATTGYANLKLVSQFVDPATDSKGVSILVQVFETLTGTLVDEEPPLRITDENGRKGWQRQVVAALGTSIASIVVGSSTYETASILDRIENLSDDARVRLRLRYIEATASEVQVGEDEIGRDDDNRRTIRRTFIQLASAAYVEGTMGSTITFASQSHALTSEEKTGNAAVRTIVRTWAQVTTTALAVGWGRLIYPFANEGDTTTKEIQQDFIIRADSYAPLALNATYANQAQFAVQPTGTFYFVGDTEPRTDRAGVTRFTRIWTMIPIARERTEGSMPWKRVGIEAGGPIGSPVSITAISSANPAVFTTVAAHGLSAGNSVLVALSFSFGGIVSFYYVKGIITTTPAANTFTFSGVGSGTGFVGTFSSGSVRLLLFGRSARMVSVSTLVRYDYYLPGVTAGVSDAADIDLPDVFEAIDGDGKLVDELTTTTFPTSTTYRQMIADREFIVTEALVRTYKGNILERRVVRAISP